MKGLLLWEHLSHQFISDLDPFSDTNRYQGARHTQTFLGCSSRDQIDNHFMAHQQGWPRQFWLIAEKSRCSILFYLLVPGGKCQAESCNPGSSTNFCNPHFHSRTRAPVRRCACPCLSVAACPCCLFVLPALTRCLSAAIL